MWFWLRRNTHKITWIHLAALSTVSHVVILLWFFFIFKESGSKLSLVVTADLFNNDIQFVVEPVRKPKAVSKATIQSKPKAKKMVQKKDAPKTTLQKEVAKKNNSQKIEQKKVASSKPVVAKKEATKSQAAQKVIEPSVPTPQKAEAAQKYELATNEQQAIGVHERGLLEEFKALREEIVASWAPPRGVALESSCQITVHVDWQGTIREMQVEKSSGVLIYDASARKVLHEIKMPRWTWGKELTISFNQ